MSLFTFLTTLIMIMLSVLFILSNHPFPMIFILLIQTALMALSLGMMFSTFWYSYILLLIYLGGMLILFLYIASLSPNLMFKSKKFLLFCTLILFLFLPLLWDQALIPLDLLNPENNSIPSSSEQSSSKLYSNNLSFLIIMVMSYLLLTLIAAANIAKSNLGPLQYKN
uniref:NADH-ubiquinone oxidoreductase chain 6 n=1 Tax=Octostigma sinensis TaxID=211997 RepID=U3KTL4_9HEXA|nr:NADH dehydrogenase subunit 6 [Octostigma sinensis]AEV44844.1 NADH dehydrogenase subunit 6 [Octostigma sinensis]